MTNRKISTIVKDQYLVKMRPTDSVQDACLRMCEQGVGAVLITDSVRQLHGIFTGRDAVRLEAETLLARCTVIHNYGHAAYGHTLSWGCAAEVATLVAEALQAG